MINKKLVLGIFLSVMLFFSFSVQISAKSVSGKVIWVSPFFGFVYIRLNNSEIPALDSDFEINLKANNKTGKITSITSYHDVTICKVEPESLVREIRKNDSVSGRIKVIKPKEKKQLIDEEIIKDYDEKLKIMQEVEATTLASIADSQLPGSSSVSLEVLKTKIAEEKFEEKKKQRSIAEENKRNADELKRRAEELKNEEEKRKKAILYSMTAKQWFDKAETVADPNYKIEYYNNALKLKPDHIEAKYKIGKTYHEMGKLGEALDEYMVVQKLDKNNSLVYNNMADIYNRLGMGDLALENAKKAVTINPSLTVAWVTLGEIYEVKGDVQKAIEAYSHAIDDSKWKSFVMDKIEKLRR